MTLIQLVILNRPNDSFRRIHNVEYFFIQFNYSLTLFFTFIKFEISDKKHKNPSLAELDDGCRLLQAEFDNFLDG